MDDRVLAALRVRSDWHGEDYIAQGLCCMLDSQRAEDIELAMRLMDELSSWTWKWNSVRYALACVASRRGAFPRALQHAATAV